MKKILGKAIYKITIITLVLGFLYNNTTYYYLRTLTGDIARIVDEFVLNIIY